MSSPYIWIAERPSDTNILNCSSVREFLLELLKPLVCVHHAATCSSGGTGEPRAGLFVGGGTSFMGVSSFVEPFSSAPFAPFVWGRRGVNRQFGFHIGVGLRLGRRRLRLLRLRLLRLHDRRHHCATGAAAIR